MVRITHHGLAAGAALEDLDLRERVAFRAHLPLCRACRDLGDELDEVVLALALAAPPRRPPDTLRDAVLASVSPSPSASPH